MDSKITLSDIKKFNKIYVTVQHPRVKECGHRFDEFHEPRHNCEFCWFAFFNTHGDLVKTVDEIFHKENGIHVLTALKGKKFVRNFTKFMSTVAQWKIEADKMKEQKDNEKEISET